MIGVFLAGGSGTILITEVLKLVSGRLRPHYFDVCEPDYRKINCSQGYIIPPSDFCNNTDTNILLDARYDQSNAFFLDFLISVLNALPGSHNFKNLMQEGLLPY